MTRNETSINSCMSLSITALFILIIYYWIIIIIIEGLIIFSYFLSSEQMKKSLGYNPLFFDLAKRWAKIYINLMNC